jgi:hypothetical protein
LGYRDLIDGVIVSAVPLINKLHILSEQATIIDSEFVESSEGTGYTDEITSFDFVISDDDIKIIVNEEYTIDFLNKMFGPHMKHPNPGYQYFVIISPKHKKGVENEGVSKNSINHKGLNPRKVIGARTEINKQLKKIINNHQLSIDAKGVLIPTSGGSSHLLGEKCSIIDGRKEK